MQDETQAGSGPAQEFVRVTSEGAVTRVVLDDPRRMNPQSPRLWARLEAVARELPQETRVVVLSGAGRASRPGSTDAS